MLLELLAARYDDGAVITVAPYMPGSSGEIFRWQLKIDGEDAADFDVRTETDPRRPEVKRLLLVHDDDELELGRWHEEADRAGAIIGGAPYQRGGATSFVSTVGGLRRRRVESSAMPEWRVDLRLLGHADQVEELERRVREATDACGEEQYRHVRPDAGDALTSVV